MLLVQIPFRERCTTLCDKVCQCPVAGRWFSSGTPVSSTNKTDRHDITEILFKVALNIIKPVIPINSVNYSSSIKKKIIIHFGYG